MPCTPEAALRPFSQIERQGNEDLENQPGVTSFSKETASQTAGGESLAGAPALFHDRKQAAPRCVTVRGNASAGCCRDPANIQGEPSEAHCPGDSPGGLSATYPCHSKEPPDSEFYPSGTGPSSTGLPHHWPGGSMEIPGGL